MLLLLVPVIFFLHRPKGDGVGFVYLGMLFSVILLSAVLLVSALALWYLHWRTVR